MSAGAASWVFWHDCLLEFVPPTRPRSLLNPNFYTPGCFPAAFCCIFMLEAASSDPVSTWERWRQTVCNGISFSSPTQLWLHPLSLVTGTCAQMSNKDWNSLVPFLEWDLPCCLTTLLCTLSHPQCELRGPSPPTPWSKTHPMKPPHPTHGAQNPTGSCCVSC